MKKIDILNNKIKDRLEKIEDLLIQINNNIDKSYKNLYTLEGKQIDKILINKIVEVSGEYIQYKTRLQDLQEQQAFLNSLLIEQI